MEKEFDLYYSEEALLSRVLFLANQFNVNIFVEDVGKEVEYEIILERMISNKFAIGCVFPVGGKSNLFKAYKLFGTPADNEKNFFIADGDFDKALKKDFIEADNFIYLNKYNIESYLINKETVIEFMRVKLDKPRKDVLRIVDYESWFSYVNPFIEKIFVFFYIIQKKNRVIKNVSYKPSKFINNLTGFAKEDEFIQYKSQFEEINGEITDIEFQTAKNDLICAYGSDAGCFACGKYYISSLQYYLMTKYSKGIKYDDLKMELIKGCDVSQLEFVKEKLCTYIAS